MEELSVWGGGVPALDDFDDAKTKPFVLGMMWLEQGGGARGCL